MNTPEENLKGIIEDIQNNKIMLPDFQRQFDWDLEKQKALVASVLTKLPVGGVLLLKADCDDYKSKRIGIDPQEAIKGPIPSKPNFLLDGQQRMTCLTNVFSDVIQDATEKKVSKLASRTLLAARFYLKIDRWNAETEPESSKDLFGLRTLDFRFDVSKDEEPDFLTAGVIDYIEYRPFLAPDYNNQKPYMPGQLYNEKLDDYCFATPDVYLIPLFLLVGSNSKDDRLRQKRLLAILKRIRDHVVESMTTHYANVEMDKKDDFAFSVTTDSLDKEKYENADDKEMAFEEIVEEKADLWLELFKNYLYSCIEQMKLNKIEMPEGSRARAIDIYENMNMGGLSLSTLDLVAARAAKSSNEALYDRILAYLVADNVYNQDAIPIEVKTYIPSGYNAGKQLGVIDSRVGKAGTDLFLEVLSLYCNNKNYDSNEAKAAYSKAQYILKLTDEEINSNCKRVCVAVDRAFCFLQTRCGVRSITDVNYKMMLRLIAYVFTNEKWYKSAKVHDKLEAWYWASIFSGEFDKDQNDRFEKNLKNILESLTNPSKGYTWIEQLKDKVLATPYFSDCSFMLMEKANEGRTPKEHLGKYICQFFLTRPYSDLISDDQKIHVFSEKLERHHIVPLGSITKIGQLTEQLREDKNNVINSPLNFVYISDDANGKISDKSLGDYEKAITPAAKASLGIANYPCVADLSDKDKVRQWLINRHSTLQGLIQNRISALLLT